MPDSLFTKIINREIPSTIRYEDDEFIVIDDIHPIAPIHVLVIPKKPYKTLEEISRNDIETQAKLLQMSRKAAEVTGILDNYKIFMNVGEKVQQILHLHIHVYGGWDLKKSREEIDKDSQQFINS